MKLLRQFFCEHRVYFDDLHRIHDTLVQAVCHRCGKKLSADHGIALGVKFDGFRPKQVPQRADVCAEIAEILRDQYESLDMDRRRALADRLSP